MIAIVTAVLAALLVPVVADAASPAQLCDSAKMSAAAAFYGCRCKADVAYVASGRTAPSTAKRDSSHKKCNATLAKSFAKLESRFGAACSTLGDAESVRASLSECRGSGFMTNRLLKTGQVANFGTGSDGAVQAGMSRSFTDNGDGTVTDDRTGLLWEKKSFDGSVHDVRNTYTWSGDTSLELNGTLVTTFLATLNTPPCFAGYCDWRIPNRTELKSLVNLEVGQPQASVFGEFDRDCVEGCDVEHCSCSATATYWSSTSWAARPELVWGVIFSLGGFDYYGAKYAVGNEPTLLRARAVRGGTG